jgi:hypothetical protein
LLASYIAAMTKELAELARAEEWATLSYLLDLAALAARMIVESPKKR